MMSLMEGPKLVLIVVLVLSCLHVNGWEDGDDIRYTNSWAVHIEDGDSEVANRIAKRHGFINLGQVGSLPGFYHFVHKPVHGRRKRREVDKGERLLTEKEVKWVEQQQILERDKRSVIPDFVGIEHPKAVIVQDPLFQDQWYLNNIGQSSGPPNLDINVLPVWSKGITGRGVVVAILDDGLDHTHPDLIQNYDSKASYDFNDYDNDPMPRTSDPSNCHGTKCAGEVAAESGNGICGVGVAFNASIGGIRMLDGNTTDTIEGSSLSFRNNYIHIYSCAWGPKDDGKRFGRPGTLASKALLLGTKEGRGGLGSIFVWATGNGGLTDDDCNCDGYTTSIYTISIGAISDHGLSTYYTESCASTLAVTYSGGSHREKRENKIITTTLNHKCTDQFKGTSSAAPLAAGMIALMLEANSKLTWRDVQAIIVDTALMTSPLDEGWRRNGAGKWFNQKFGFGRMDALQLINKAKTWDNIPEQRKCWGDKNDGPWKIPESGTLLVPTNATACSDTALEIRNLEHVQIVMSLKHRHRGHLSIELISPSGTRSQILKTRRNDHSNKGLRDWIFMSVHFWGEDPRGTWTLAVTDNSNNNRRHYRSKVKHGDLEDATEALQDELLGRPRLQEDDIEGSSQAHEGVLEKSERNADTKVSEDFEGGIFESKSYRSSKKHSDKEKKRKTKKKTKRKKKEKGKQKKNHRHHFSHKKSRPTVKIKEVTFEPTFLGKTFGALTQNKQGQHHPTPTQSVSIPAQSYMSQNRQPYGYNHSGIAVPQGSSQANFSRTGTNWAQFHVSQTGQEHGSQNSVVGVNPDQTLNPTTRHNFETTSSSSSQHDVIQGLVKSVLSELFTALREQRNESEIRDTKIDNRLQGKIAAKESMENVSSSLTKAWRSEKGVQKINSLISILDKVKSMDLHINHSDAEVNGTRADEMVSDVLKVLRDILSARKTDEKTGEFKMRVAKLVGDSSNETRNLTQKLFDDLQLKDDGNRTTLVINDAVSLISHIFKDDTEKKKSSTPSESAQAAALLGQMGIIFKRPDGSLLIPNPNEIQVQGSPESIIRSWSNASQIETVRIEHTKISPVNFESIASKHLESRVVNTTSPNEKAQTATIGRLGGKERKDNEADDIEMEVERSGDGRSKNVDDFDYSSIRGQTTERIFRNEDASPITGRSDGGTGGSGFVDGKAIPDVGSVSGKFDASNGARKSHARKIVFDDTRSSKLHAKSKVSSEGAADHSYRKVMPGDASSKSKSPNDQIDVTVFFDNNSDKDFANEVNDLKSESKSKKPDHDKFSSLRKDSPLEDFKIQKPQVISGKGMGSKNLEGRYFSLPVGTVMQPSDMEDEENTDEEENSRSKGEIPEGDAEEDDEKDSPSPGMYDLRESLPFFSMPVADQHGYSLLAPVFDPYQDSPYSAGLDIVNAEEQAPFIDDESDFYEPSTLKHTWKRSLPEPLLKERNPPVATPQDSLGQPAFETMRHRRGILQQAYLPEIRRPPQIPLSSVRSRIKRDTGVVSARKRFAEIIRKVHERSVKRRSVGHDAVPSRLFGRHTLLSESTNVLPQQSIQPSIRVVVPHVVEQRSIPAVKVQSSVRNSINVRSRRRRRSVGETDTDVKFQGDKVTKNTFSNVTVHREKRNKIVDDYDDIGTDDFENEPHVVKRSAIFGSLDSTVDENNDAIVREGTMQDPRTKRHADDDDDDDEEDGADSEGERRQLSSERRVSSLEESLRKKLLSMKTQSKSVLKLLKRVHDDISGGNTNDLFKLEAEIAGIEKREHEASDKSNGREEKSSRKSKRQKKSEKRKNHERSKEKLRAKSVTPYIKHNAQFTSENDSDDGTADSAEAQEKLAFKQNPDEYLKYGAGNTGVLESWTLVFYGT